MAAPYNLAGSSLKDMQLTLPISGCLPRLCIIALALVNSPKGISDSGEATGKGAPELCCATNAWREAARCTEV